MRGTDFVHRFLPGRNPEAPVLLLLHGTGGNEEDLLPLGRALAPGAALLSPRGRVLENGMPRFFRRLAEGVFDHQDLVRRTHELAGFVRWAAGEYRFDAERIFAAGYSNGANIAASLLLLHPGMLRGAVLFRPMVPFEPEDPPDLSGTGVFIAAGRHDPLIPPGHPERLAAILREAGAEAELRWYEAGHALGPGEVEEARDWLSGALRRTRQ